MVCCGSICSELTWQIPFCVGLQHVGLNLSGGSLPETISDEVGSVLGVG